MIMYKDKRKTDFDQYIDDLTCHPNGKHIFDMAGLQLDIALLIYHVRVDSGLSRSVCAKKLGIKIADLTLMEQGGYDFNLSFLVHFAAIFDKKLSLRLK
jgi:ribosome-binding protein aMBF1 (putative translation factor)